MSNRDRLLLLVPFPWQARVTEVSNRRFQLVPNGLPAEVLYPHGGVIIGDVRRRALPPITPIDTKKALYFAGRAIPQIPEHFEVIPLHIRQRLHPEPLQEIEQLQFVAFGLFGQATHSGIQQFGKPMADLQALVIAQGAGVLDQPKLGCPAGIWWFGECCKADVVE